MPAKKMKAAKILNRKMSMSTTRLTIPAHFNRPAFSGVSFLILSRSIKATSKVTTLGINNEKETKYITGASTKSEYVIRTFIPIIYFLFLKFK